MKGWNEGDDGENLDDDEGVEEHLGLDYEHQVEGEGEDLQVVHRSSNLLRTGFLLALAVVLGSIHWAGYVLGVFVVVKTFSLFESETAEERDAREEQQRRLKRLKRREGIASIRRLNIARQMQGLKLSDEVESTTDDEDLE